MTDESSAAFLKLATAAPDFENLDTEGIPDDFSGPTFCMKDFAYFTVGAEAGKVTYFVMHPTSGVAYSTVSYDLNPDGSVPYSNDPLVMPALNFKGVDFPNADDLFDGADNPYNTANISSGRMMASSAELVSLNNAFTQYGSISTIKTPCKRVLSEQVPDVAQYHITGVRQFLLPALQNGSTIGAVREGSYAVAMNRESEFNFYDTIDDFISTTETSAMQTKTRTCQFEGMMPNWDNGYDSIIFRIVVPAGVDDQAFILKVWRAWEYQPVANSFVASLAHSSPPKDPRIMNLYHELSRNLPVAVPAKDNPDFWMTMLDVIDTTSEVLSAFPVVGPIARGVHAVTSVVERAVHRKKNRNKKKPASKPRKPVKKNKSKKR